MVVDQPAATPFFSIKVDGADLPAESRGEITRLVVEECLDAAGGFEIELSNWDMDRQQVTWSDASTFAPGAAVEISLGYVGATELVMAGEVTGLELSFPDRARSLVTVRGYDRLHRFRRGRRTRTYLQVKDSDVATEIANDLGLTPDVEVSAEVHPYLLQVSQTDVDFLLARARAIGYELLVDDRTLRFRKVRNERGKVLTLDFTHGLITFDGSLSTADQVGQVTVRGWDPAKKEAIVGQAKGSDISSAMGSRIGAAATDGLFGARTLTVVDQPIASQSEADLLARGILDEIALGYVVGEATANGNPAIRVGTVVELGGLGTRFSGSYYVTRVRHVWHGEFLTYLQVRRNAA